MYSALGVNQTASTIGGLAVGVPGELRAWELLHARHGSLPWASLFAPAINLARNGFRVNVDLAAAIAMYEDGFITQEPLWAEAYTDGNGTILVEGDTAYRKRYADTLETISKQGAGAFYNRSSEIAQNTISAVQGSGGIMTFDDLEGYEALIREPLNITYRGQRVFSTVAPSSGAVVASALKIAEGYNLSAQEGEPGYNLSTHYLLQATEFAYGQRTTYGDPAFTPNVTDLQREYLTPAVYEELRSKIVDNQTFPVSYYSPEDYLPNLGAQREAGTSHVGHFNRLGSLVSVLIRFICSWQSSTRAAWRCL